MPLRLDPRLPLVWRSPNSLQLGVDRPVVVLDHISNAEERMLAALVGGTSLEALSHVAESAGACPRDAEDLVRRLRPALEQAPQRRPRGDVVVTGVGPTADRIRFSLDERGLLARDDTAGPQVGLAIVVAHFVVDPADRARWLSRDIPHIPVVLGDSAVQLGPVIEPGTNACLQCLELHRRDLDPAWPAIASQLWGRASAVDTPVFAGEIVVNLLRIIDSGSVAAQGADGTSEPVSTSMTIDRETGERITREWRLHPECGCATPPGTGSAAGHHSAAGPATTTGSAAPALA